MDCEDIFFEEESENISTDNSSEFEENYHDIDLIKDEEISDVESTVNFSSNLTLPTSDVEESSADKNWNTSDFNRTNEHFQGTPGVKIHPEDPESVADVISLFFGRDLFEKITRETNKYHSLNAHKYKVADKSSPWGCDVTVEELKQFFGLLIIMGQVRKKKIGDYWSTDPLIKTSIFPRTMSRNRFLLMLRYLSFDNNDDECENPNILFRIRKIINYFSKKFQTVYKPKQDLVLQESVVPWRGKLNFKVYNPNVVNKPGIHSRILCEADTGYICNMKLFTADEIKSENSILATLYCSSRLWHHVYMHNYYTSVKLAKKLHDMKIGVCGTIRKNQGFPDALKNSNLELYQSKFRHKGPILLQVWRGIGKNNLQMISTVHGSEMQYTLKELPGMACIPKPKSLIDFNKYIKRPYGNPNAAFPPISRKTKDCTRKLVMHLFNCAMFNAFHVYIHVNSNNKMRYDEFVLSIARAWLNQSYSMDDLSTKSIDEINRTVPIYSARVPREDPPDRLSGDMNKHMMVKIYSIYTKSQVRKRCRVCSSHHKRKDTGRMCGHCKVPLHVGECFHAYHTKQFY